MEILIIYDAIMDPRLLGVALTACQVQFFHVSKLERKVDAPWMERRAETVRYAGFTLQSAKIDVARSDRRVPRGQGKSRHPPEATHGKQKVVKLAGTVKPRVTHNNISAGQFALVVFLTFALARHKQEKTDRTLASAASCLRRVERLSAGINCGTRKRAPPDGELSREEHWRLRALGVSRERRRHDHQYARR